MAKETIDGEAAVMMIMEIVEDVDDDALLLMLRAALGKPVKLIAEDQFEIEWD